MFNPGGSTPGPYNIQISRTFILREGDNRIACHHFNNNPNLMILIGYSGHSYVINGILNAQGIRVTGYCDNSEKQYNPLSIQYFGTETSSSGLEAIKRDGFFISVGNNGLRNKINGNLKRYDLFPINATHPTSVIDQTSSISTRGVMICTYVVINAFAKIGMGVICNTGSIIEHECVIGDFAHIGPGAILCGNVHVGENTMIGAGAVVREGIRIGKNVIVGAGSVVVNDIEDDRKVVGNPARQIN